MTDTERNRLKRSIQKSRIFGAQDNDIVYADCLDSYSVSFTTASGERIEMPLSELNNYA